LFFSVNQRGKLQELGEELIDNFYYLNDILGGDNDSLNRVLTFHLMEFLIIPLFLQNIQQTSSERVRAHSHSYTCSYISFNLINSCSHLKPELELPAPLALHLLAQVMHIFNYPLLANSLAGVLIHPLPEEYKSYPLSAGLRAFQELPKYLHTPEPDPQPARNSAPKIDSLYSTMRTAGTKGSTSIPSLDPLTPHKLKPFKA
jgi:hypothetical protein